MKDRSQAITKELDRITTLYETLNDALIDNINGHFRELNRGMQDALKKTVTSLEQGYNRYQFWKMFKGGFLTAFFTFALCTAAVAAVAHYWLKLF